MGRNYCLGAPTAIVCSFLTHYSVVKAANLLGVGIKPKKNGGLHLLGADNHGRILLDQLKDRVYSLAKNGVVNVIIVGNAGATMLGSVDNIPAMNDIIERASGLFPITNFHFHVDAAMGGFIIPFIAGIPHIGFENSKVCSATIDVHKLGLAPYGSGIILARRGLFERIKSIAPYVPGNDSTLCGSRAGVMALSCWAVMRKLGKSGYAKNARNFMNLVCYAQERLGELGIETFSSDINVVAVRQSFPSLLNKKFITHVQESFPADLSRPFSGNKRCVWNIVVMSHTTKELLGELFSDLSELKRRGECR
ncbi:MAG: pyridoxal-dependent decarboxylase [Patescibacteria group bacterium]